MEYEIGEVVYWSNMESIRRLSDYKVSVYLTFLSRTNAHKTFLQAHKESVSAVSMSVDNFWVFSASHDSKLKMYSIEEMQVLRNIEVSSCDSFVALFLLKCTYIIIDAPGRRRKRN